MRQNPRKRRIANACPPGLALLMITLCSILINVGESKGQQSTDHLNAEKTNLEIRRLKLEISRLEKDSPALPGWITGLIVEIGRAHV